MSAAVGSDLNLAKSTLLFSNEKDFRALLRALDDGLFMQRPPRVEVSSGSTGTVVIRPHRTYNVCGVFYLNAQKLN